MSKKYHKKYTDILDLPIKSNCVKISVGNNTLDEGGNYVKR